MIKVAGVLLRQNGKYLLQHRNDGHGVFEAGKYAVWGGVVDENESYIAAAIRELEEETGFILKTDDLKEIAIIRDEVIPILSETKQKREFYIYLADINESIDVLCLEGQGIVSVNSLDDVHLDKLTTSLTELRDSIG